LDLNSGPRVSKRDIAEKHSNSTVGQIAALSNSTRHKAEQAVRVLDHGTPELQQQVESGQISLREAGKQVKPAKPKRPAKPAAPRNDTVLSPMAFIAHLQERITARRLQAKYMAYGEAGLVRILDWVQSALDAFTRNRAKGKNRDQR
jgi:hypothetical protein